MKEKQLCLRCGHEWLSRAIPEQCPNCKSRYYDTPPKNTGAKTHTKRKE